MIQTSPPRSRILEHAEPTHLSSLLGRAALWSFLVSAVLAVAVVGLSWIQVALAPDAALPEGQEYSVLGTRLLVGWVAFFILLFPLRLLWISPAMDTAFKALGFLATFFGLGMLLLFLLSLAVDVFQWFAETRLLVESKNIEIARQQQAIQTAEKNYEAAKKVVTDRVLQEMREIDFVEIDNDPSLTPAEKLVEKAKTEKRYQERIIPDQLQQESQKVADLKKTLGQGSRSDSSGFALLAHFLFSGSGYTLATPQNASIYFALVGSMLVSLLTILFAVPVGVAAALYLEEYRSKGWFGKLIQININNLAGVPSVVYGILGSFVFVELIFKPLALLDPGAGISPRNLLGGGLTLGLLTLPVVIVSAQEAIRAVPRSIRDGAYALGATRWQTIWRNVLPMATPGILTGTILSLSRAIGEAAPLVLFGAVLYIDQPPHLLSRFTVVPMQIFTWVDSPTHTEDIFLPDGSTQHVSFELWHHNAALAIVVLLFVLLCMNGVAIYLRNRAQRNMRY